jgi:SAM-dependent methyltransferase
MATLRTATVMFTDLVASTARAARVGPARADELRVEHFDLVRGVLAVHGGAEVKTLGDGVMAVFDSVVAAVDAAVALQQALDASNRTNPDPPQLRIGLGVGEVSREGADVFGAAVVESARICAVAEPKQILCTSLVRHLAESHSTQTFRSAGRRELKGLPDATDLEEVAWSPLMEPGVLHDFARVDEWSAERATACLDLQQESVFLVALRRRILELLAPRPGHVVVDVGCGAGHDVLHLGRVVGPEGRAIGIDKSSAMVDEATRRSLEHRPGNVEFRVGDATALPLDDDHADAARADRVFQYVADPRSAMRELVRVTRPGGLVVVADTDWGASTFDCDDLELGARIDAAWMRTRASGRVGRQLYGLFVRAGLEDVRVEPHVLADTAAVETDGFASLYRPELLRGLAAQAVETGAVSAAEAARWVAMQDLASAQGRYFRFLAMFVAVGRVPGSTGS